ncbi:MAG: hypothetical protein ABSG05_00600 [Candidatus Pacearchaeota archaeon]|jgi:hypothetical protein
MKNYRNIRSKVIGLGIAAMATAFASCKDVPFMPRWDTDFYMPLSTRAIYLKDYFQFGFIPSGISANVSFSPEKQELPGVVRDALKNIETNSTRARTVLTLNLSKSTPITTSDTILITKDSASLTNPGLEDIVFPVNLGSNDTLVTDSIQLTMPSIRMLQDAAYNGSPLWVQMRGYVSNDSSYSIPINASDSITAKLSITARIFISERGGGKP